MLIFPRLEKIVFNLVSNAFKFTTKGYIRITSSVDAHYFYLHVEDSGIGIPADQLASVFERFVRVENSEARSIEGSGIGLSKCYRSDLASSKADHSHRLNVGARQDAWRKDGRRQYLRPGFNL